MMTTLHLHKKTGADGVLSLEVPVGEADAECDIVVIVGKKDAPSEWLPGFWENLSQGWEGPPLERPAQGACDVRTPLS
jgi:hypothetical protein